VALVAVYLVGLAWYLLRLVVGWTLLMRLAARADAPEGALAARLAAIAPSAAPLVRIHHRIQTPATWGWRRPAILLPPEALTWPVDRLRAVLEHERAHVERADVASNLLAELYRAIYWPNPLAALAGRRVRLLAEIACDARASERVGRQPYARALLVSLEEQAESGLAGILAPGAISYMRERIGALVRPENRRDGVSGRLRLVVIATVLVGQALMMALVPDIARATAAMSSVEPASHASIHQAQHAAAHAAHQQEHGR
jgi:beta-lactamase regulating signal transducer with metallopeptidase domain